MTSIEATAEPDPEGVVMVELNTQKSEHTYALSENEARRLIIDLINATDMVMDE